MDVDDLLMTSNNNSLLVEGMDTSELTHDELAVESKNKPHAPLSLKTTSRSDNVDLFESMASTSSDQNTIAQKTWEMANNVETISTIDEIYRYDRKEQQDILTAKPWEKE